MTITIELSFLDILLRLCRSWIDQYNIHPDDVDLYTLVELALLGDMPPRKIEPQMDVDIRQGDLFNGWKEIA